ncbi:MAG: sigma factor, partial [Candidatus Kapaibacterium sp.]
MKENFETYSDSELVELLKRDKSTSSAAFKVLYDRYSSIVHAYCCKVLGYGENAEDVFQETFIKFYNNCNKETVKFNIQGYLLTIARNLCLNVKRDRKVTVSTDYLDMYYADEQPYEQKELLDLINRTIE